MSEMYGFAKIKCENGKLKIYSQWSEQEQIDWTKGEDLVFLLPEDAEDLKTILNDTHIENVEIDKYGSITLWLKSKI